MWKRSESPATFGLHIANLLQAILSIPILFWLLPCILMRVFLYFARRTGFNASQTKILPEIRHSMYSSVTRCIQTKENNKKDTLIFSRIKLQKLNFLLRFYTCLVAWRLLRWIYVCKLHVLIFCFTTIIILFKMVHISIARDLGKEIYW